MNMLVVALLCVLMVWMLACGWCGFRRSFVPFCVMLGAGLALNMAWMMIGLDAHLFEPHALLAQAAATLYAGCAFGFGWIAGRIKDAWRQSTVES